MLVSKGFVVYQLVLRLQREGVAGGIGATVGVVVRPEHAGGLLWEELAVFRGAHVHRNPSLVLQSEGEVIL